MAVCGATIGLNPFPAGTTQAQAGTQFDGKVSRVSAYAGTKAYMAEGGTPTAIGKGQDGGKVTFILAQGGALFISLKPTVADYRNNTGQAERTALNNYLGILAANGFTPANCWVTLWQEANNAKAPFTSGADYIGYCKYYWTAAAQAYGFKLFYDPAMGSSQSNSFFLSYYDKTIHDGICVDYYGIAYRNGHRVDFLRDQANADGRMFGIGEWGQVGSQESTGLSQADWNSYVNYLITVLGGVTTSVPFAFYFNGIGTNPNNMVPTEPGITGYSKVAGYQKLFDAVTAGGSGTSATFTKVQTGSTVTGATGTLGLWFSQSGGAATTAGTLLVARVQADDGSMTYTPPAGWAAGPNVASGAGTSGVSRSTIFYYLGNPGSLYGTSGAAANFTYSNSAANVRGRISEFSAPAGTAQHYDTTPAATGSGTSPVTSFPLTGGGAVTASGCLGAANFAAHYSANIPAGNSWTGPGGSWTSDGLSATGVQNAFALYNNTAISSGTPSLTAQISTSTNQTGWAAAAAFFYTTTSAPSITTASLPNATRGAAYSQALAVTGGTAPYTWTVLSGSLPPGTSLSSGGTISGTVTGSGIATYTFTAKVTDNVSATATKTLTITAADALSVTTASLPGGSTGVAYSQALAATGGIPAYKWAVTAGALPPGLGLNSATGVISGQPQSTAGSPFSFTVKATDTAGTAATAALSIAVSTGALAITTAALPPGILGKTYTAQLAASGGVPPYTWAVTAGALPPGLALASTGLVTGTLLSDGAYPFTVRVTDSS